VRVESHNGSVQVSVVNGDFPSRLFLVTTELSLAVVKTHADPIDCSQFEMRIHQVRIPRFWNKGSQAAQTNRAA